MRKTKESMRRAEIEYEKARLKERLGLKVVPGRERRNERGVGSCAAAYAATPEITL
jgi:hypothetical protein